jgi:hypothetical protein
MLFNFVLEYALRKVHTNQKVLKLNGALQLLAYVDGVTVLGENMYENTQALLVASMEFYLKVRVNETNATFVIGKSNAEKGHNINEANSLKIWHIYFIWERHSKIKIYVAEENNSRLNSAKACYEAFQNVMSCRLLSATTQVKFYVIVIVSAVLFGCET